MNDTLLFCASKPPDQPLVAHMEWTVSLMIADNHFKITHEFLLVCSLCISMLTLPLKCHIIIDYQM